MNSYTNFADGTVSGLAAAVIAAAIRDDIDWAWQCPDDLNFWLSLTDIDPDQFRRRVARQLRQSA